MEKEHGILGKIRDDYFFRKTHKKLNSVKPNFTQSDIPYLKKIFSGGMLSPKHIAQIAQQVNDKSFIIYCIENPILGLKDPEKVELIKFLGDDEYTISCIFNRSLWDNKTIDLFSLQWQLIESMGKDYIKRFIENPDTGISTVEKVDLIKGIGDSEYIKQCIQRAPELGINSKKIKTKLICETKDEEYIRQQFMPKSVDTKIDLPEGMTIGTEIEVEKNAHLSLHEFLGWKSKADTSLDYGQEFVSPVMTGSERDAENIHIICNMIQQAGGEATTNCGGHIHIGADYLTSDQSFWNLAALWCNTEKVLYEICNKPGDQLRGISYAVPLSGRFEAAIERDDILSKNRIVQALQEIQAKDKTVGRTKFFSMNMSNVGTPDQNTIEFRIPNGTIDPQTWIENINLFGGIVRAAEELAQMQKKSHKMLTEKEKKKLEAFNRLCSGKLAEDEQLSILLTLAVSEDKRGIYEERYQVNSVLLKNSFLGARIDEQLAKKPINPYLIGKAVLTGPEAVTGPEMQAANLRLIRDRENMRTNVTQEQDTDRIA